MSVAGISSNNFFNYNSQSVQNQIQQFQQEFQQLGQDLQSGNLSAAQADFATLQQNRPTSTSSSQSNNPIAQEFNQLSQDLQSGNLTAAQQDYAQLQQDFQNQGVHGHHHHHHGNGDWQSSVNSLLNQLGQSLQAGNLTAAQQEYSALQQDFQQFSQATGTTSTATSSPSSSTGISVSA